MKEIIITCAMLLIFMPIHAQYESYKDNKSYSYAETCAAYQDMANKYPRAELMEMGSSDIGKPILLFLISKDKDFDPTSIHAKGKTILLINNAIHPGEPCGVDASIKLAHDLLSSNKYAAFLDNTVVAIIPFYNVGGGINRSCCSRAGQNGPDEYGFRGNAQNRDLNRDFIKCDTKNAVTFTKIYHFLNPHVFIDTHTTNGADFQYTMSLLATQPDKLNPSLKKFLREEMLPDLYTAMKKERKEIIPYVYFYGKTLADGIQDYLDSPRYSTGFTTLFNTIGFVTEALKYKPYPNRVEHTYAFLLNTLEWMSKNNEAVRLAKEKAVEEVKHQEQFELVWELDTTYVETIDFKGYKTTMQKSEFGKNNNYVVYQQDSPINTTISYYPKYKATQTIDKPRYYVVPQAYAAVIQRLKWNHVVMQGLDHDTLMEVEMYFIEGFKTVKTPYEGHYLHYEVNVKKKEMVVQYHQGDYLIALNQVGNRYIVETLEPQGMDSFFAWNFFDGILQQKEWFSPFSFEKIASILLQNNDHLREDFEKRKGEDAEFSKSRKLQLRFIYERSPYYEGTHNRYPIGRVI